MRDRHFCKGERVRAIRDFCRITKEMTGTVIEGGIKSVCVEWDKYVNGHSAFGGKDGHCWFVDGRDLEMIHSNHISNR